MNVGLVIFLVLAGAAIYVEAMTAIACVLRSRTHTRRVTGIPLASIILISIGLVWVPDFRSRFGFSPFALLVCWIGLHFLTSWVWPAMLNAMLSRRLERERVARTETSAVTEEVTSTFSHEIECRKTPDSENRRQ